MNGEFDAWWAAQNTGLGVAHRFTAWNAWLAATLKEREACAKVCDKIAGADLYGQAGQAADAIRMRSNA